MSSQVNLVVAGPDDASKAFARSLAQALGIELCEASYKRFPDGEQYVRLPCQVKGRIAAVVKTFYPDQDSSLVTSVLLADAVLEAGGEPGLLVAPYLAYARQDRAFLEGEPVSIRGVLKSLWSAGYRSLVTVEIHKVDSLRHFPGKALSVRPFEFMARSLGLGGSSDLVVISPDLGGVERARSLAQALGVGHDFLEKSRDRVTGEIALKPKSVDVGGKRVIIVDDVISTGGTVAEATKMLKGLGAREVKVMVAHALLVQGAAERLRSSGVDAVYAANTTPPTNMVAQVDVAPLVARAIREEVSP